MCHLYIIIDPIFISCWQLKGLLRPYISVSKYFGLYSSPCSGLAWNGSFGIDEAIYSAQISFTSEV